MGGIDSSGISINPSRLRLDAWVRIRKQAEGLNVLAGKGSDTAEQAERLSAEFAVIEPFEQYWAFPTNA